MVELKVIGLQVIALFVIADAASDTVADIPEEQDPLTGGITVPFAQ